ncbi:MAG: SPASM domain-containing protein [Salinivirgaceae bacterium]|nr:SPASM domain-containing protein [Salinivirgaceae bacterium]
MYHLSRFNTSWQKGGDFFLHNSLSNSFIKLDNSLYDLLKAKKITDKLPIDLIEYLKKNYFIIDNIDDDINQFRKLFTISRYRSDVLNLTIAPTTFCNFKCPYCYEEGIEYEMMDTNTEKEICKYINSSQEKNVAIVWYGGEPLMAFDKIVSISNYVIKCGKYLKTSIVTNGYLLTNEKVEILKSYNVKNIQITIDGIELEHDKTRVHINGKPTFWKIIENISYILNETDIFCSIRVNISKQKNEFQNVLNFFNDKFGGLRYNVHSAFIRDSSGLLQKIKPLSCNEGMSFQDKVVFQRTSYTKNNSKQYPILKINDCTARSLNSFVISPSGDFFKCWEDIHNKDLAIFNIHRSNKIRNNLLNKYLFSADVLTDEKCIKCNILPICGGGCPVSRIKSLNNADYDHDCDVYKNNIEEFLTYYYENTTN